MTAIGDEPSVEAQPPERPWRGVRVTGGDLRIKNLSFKINEDGTIASNPVTVELRTEMWPYWLEEAIEAAVAASDAAQPIPEIVARLDAAEDERSRQQIDQELSAIMAKELRASMRAISACAFAIDGFYAAVKVRSDRHPQQDDWNKKRTSRHAQVTETIRHHLKITKPAQARALKERVSATFKWRDWAVHPGSNYKEPVPRQDVQLRARANEPDPR